MQHHDEHVPPNDPSPASPGERRASTASAARNWLGSDFGIIRSEERTAARSNTVDETTTLLEEGRQGIDSQPVDVGIVNALDLLKENGVVQTTWKHEAKVLASYSRPLIITFLLQYSIPLVSVVTVGHLGKAELGAVSISSSGSTLCTANKDSLNADP